MVSTWQQNAQRASFAGRISTLFERRSQSQASDSARATATFEVPLFLSPARYQPTQAVEAEHLGDGARSRSSIQSLIESATFVGGRIRPGALPPSSYYSSSTSSHALHQAPTLPVSEPSRYGSTEWSEHTQPPAHMAKNPQRTRRRKRTSTKVKLQSLKRISAAFGATLLATLVTYLILAATGTATGVMFHVSMVLLILSLTGVFAHSAIRLVILSKSAKERRHHRRHQGGWHGQIGRVNGSFFGEVAPDRLEECEEHLPEKPIRVIMVEDEEVGPRTKSIGVPVRQPPPVYGNVRSSKRINPSLVHWQKVPPSPLTPTYDEAMSEAHRAVGYRPPSYIESESGATYIIEQGTADVEQALRNIHPLERERLAQLAQNMI